jgi:LPS export ABC transporter protein LptC
MKMMPKKTVTLTLLFLAALLVSLLVMKKFAEHSSKTLVPTQKVIIAFADEITYKSYDKNGLLQAKILATSMENYQTNQQSVFKYPHGLVYTKKRIPWYIRANEGIAKNKTEWIDLYGNVIMHQLPLSHRPETTIKTEALSINPKKELAKTNLYVSLQQLGNKIEGVGMNANMNTGVIDISSHSKGYYQPAASKTSSH